MRKLGAKSPSKSIFIIPRFRDNVSDFVEQAELTDDQRTAIAHRNAENVMRIKAT